MKTRPFLLLFALLLTAQLLTTGSAAAQVNVRIGGYYGPPRAYYGPRYYRPRPVVYAVPPPRPVVVVPAPYYYAPAPRVYYAPRPYPYRGHYGRRW
jgi:hypothetical protein